MDEDKKIKIQDLKKRTRDVFNYDRITYTHKSGEYALRLQTRVYMRHKERGCINRSHKCFRFYTIKSYPETNCFIEFVNRWEKLLASETLAHVGKPETENEVQPKYYKDNQFINEILNGY